MTGELPLSAAVMSALQVLCGLALPAAAGLTVHKKYGGRWGAFWVGVVIFMTFAGIAESVVHQLVLGATYAGGVILENVWLYALYGGAMAALFEEGGRYFAFRKLLSGSQENDADALMYGAGHGGVEAFVLLTLSGAGDLVSLYLLRIGRGDMLGAEQAAQAAEALRTTAWWAYLLGIYERIPALVLHLSLSVPVWFAAKDGRRRAPLLLLAGGLHLLADALAVLLAAFLPPVAAELGVTAMAVLAVLAARKVWREEKDLASRPH